MILSDKSLRAVLQAGDLVVDPAPEDAAIQPASIDLRLGRQFRRVDGEPWEADTLHLMPGVLVLGHTVETVGIPRWLVAQLNGKSSLARLGVTVHQTAGYIDPGFHGQITLELANFGPAPVTLRAGQRIGQLVLIRLTTPASRPYGTPEIGSHYQGQVGATPSALRGES